MTKEECLELVRLTHHTYDRTLIRKDELEIGSAWYPYVKDFELEDAKKAFIDLSMQSEYMPKVMELRKALINTRTKVTPPPLPHIAWATFLTLISNANSGMHTPIDVHECLQKTMNALGDAKYSMNAQYDQKRFEAVYEDAVRKYERDLYKI